MSLYYGANQHIICVQKWLRQGALKSFFGLSVLVDDLQYAISRKYGCTREKDRKESGQVVASNTINCPEDVRKNVEKRSNYCTD